MKYKITYFEDGERTKVASKIEETTETQSQLLGHSHVITVELIGEENKTKPKKVNANKSRKD